MPVVALFCGADVVTHDRWSGDATPDWARQMGRGYAMEAVHSFPGDPDLAVRLVTGMIERGIDVAISCGVNDPHKAGFGHAFGFVMKRLLAGASSPVIPLLLNTYYPPNVPTARRCHDIGRALREAIRQSASEQRIAVVASGGLSHFIIDETLDRRVIEGFSPDKAEQLRDLPRGALMSGSSEILNWVLAAGAVDHLPLKWVEYHPVYRTPAGTGVGTAFAVWAEEDNDVPA